MKLGVLQFFSWPERRVPLETMFARALERIEIMDRTGRGPQAQKIPPSE